MPTCVDCERPLPSNQQIEHAEGRGGCECEMCASLCWRGWYGDVCQDPKDWRKEANVLRAEVARLREELAQAGRENDRLREDGVHVFCKAADEWLAAIENAGDSRIGVEPVEIHNVFRAIRKSNLLWRLLYGEKEVRTERCEKHGGHWSGIPFDETHACCDLTGWKRGPAAERMAAEAKALGGGKETA